MATGQVEQTKNGDDGLDILAVKGSTESIFFRISFDFWYCKPKCIIEAKNSADIKCDIQQLTVEQRHEFFRVAQEFYEVFQLDVSGFNATLSIHRGEWDRKNRILPFHADICFGEAGKETYLKIFKEINKSPPMRNFWPSMAPERFVTQQWHQKRPEFQPHVTPENIDALHEEYVRKFPTWNWKIYDQKKVNTLIWENIPSNIISGFENVVFSKSQPQVGLRWLGSWMSDKGKDDKTIHMEAYLDELSRLMNYLMRNVEGCNGGHLCISIQGCGFPGFGVDDVYGYLHLNGHSFYRICPEAAREEWFSNYMEWDGKVFT